jgi:hypothetical protein
MWNFLSSLVSWIPAVIKAMSRNKKLDSAIDRVEKLEKIKLDPLDKKPVQVAADKWVAARPESRK